MTTFTERCKELLRANDRGGHTVPSPNLYPHQWAWDSAFAAIGWAHVDMERAIVELETLMAGAWADGRVPHIIFHDLRGDYFPGPSFWETERSSSITQPPVWATAARKLYELGADATRIAKLMPALEASHKFFKEQRDPANIGCVAVVHPWESGLDNSPAWDRGMALIDPVDAPEFKRVDKERVADPEQRPTDEDYKRYTILVKAIAADGFGAGRFATYDPLMTTLLCKAEEDLFWLSEKLGVESGARERAEALRQGLSALWSPEHGRYGFRGTEPSSFEATDVLSAYAPLLLGLHEEELRSGLAPYLDCEQPLPSTSPSHARFDPRCYWRGPTWINMNWLFAPHVGGDLREASLRTIEKNGFWEYYDPRSGEGLGANQFTWTAALALDWASS